jgi:hypothetical protein
LTFEARNEAAQILGVPESHMTLTKLKDAHRRIMLANHPVSAGSKLGGQGESGRASGANKADY